MGYRMKTVARETGLSPLLIRAWERRYELVRPRRGENGFREYSELDVRVLRAARALVEKGRPIGEVAGLPRHRLLEEGEAAAAGVGPDAPRPLAREVDALLEAVTRSDAVAAQRSLSRAFALLPPERAAEEVLLPVLRRIGEAWERGTICPGQEHLASDLVRHRIRSLVEAASPHSGGARGSVLAACLPGERHDLPLLFAIHRIVRHGFVPVILGADVPLRDVVAIARSYGNSLVALSVTMDDVYRESARALSKLRAQLPETARLAIGGHATVRFSEQLASWGFEVAPPEAKV